MTLRRLFTLPTLLAGLLCLAPLSMAQQEDPIDLAKEVPDALITFESKSAQLLIGGSKGEGILRYNGEEYPFKFKGASAGAAVSLAKAAGEGKVYRLKKLEDFPGIFTQAGAGVALVKGAGTAVLENNNGVVLSVTEKSKGVSIDLSAGGINISFE